MYQHSKPHKFCKLKNKSNGIANAIKWNKHKLIETLGSCEKVNKKLRHDSDKCCPEYNYSLYTSCK